MADHSPISAANKIPGTSLIICSRNRPELLLESIISILQGERIPAELIVIDQSDEPQPMLEALAETWQADLHYEWLPIKGLSRANNHGARIAKHDLLVFTHDDVLVTRTWFGILVDALQCAGPRVVVTGQVGITEAERAGGFQLTAKTDLEPAVYSGRVGKDVLLPLNMAVYRSTLFACGGFDERLGPGTPYPGAEDNDLGLRLLEAGYQIRYVPEAILYHRAWRPASGYLALRWHYGLARGAFYAKHFGASDRYIVRRMAGDIMTHMRSSLYKLWRTPDRALGDTLLMAGIAAGAMRWSLVENRAGSGYKSPG